MLLGMFLDDVRWFEICGRIGVLGCGGSFWGFGKGRGEVGDWVWWWWMNYGVFSDRIGVVFEMEDCVEL